jgi:copper chaperone
MGEFTMTTEVIKVEGMSCGHCVKSVEGAVQEVGAKGKVDLENKSVTVEFNEGEVTLAKIKEAIEEQGYDVV